MNESGPVQGEKMIETTQDYYDFLHELTGGNLGATRVIAEAVNDSPPVLAAIILQALKYLNLTGCAIWVLYKDECGEDIKAFCKSVLVKCADKIIIP